MPAMSESLRSESRATRRCSRMNSPRSCMRASNWSFTSVTGVTVASASGAAANAGRGWTMCSAPDEALDVVEQLDRREGLAEEIVGPGLAAGLLDDGVVAARGQ